MDISTLNSHYERLQQLSKNEGTLDGLKSGAANCTGLFATEIADLDSQIEQIAAKSDAKEAQLAVWIVGIRDPRTRLVFRLRFFRALSWKEIAKNNPHNDGHGKSHRVPIFERRNPLHTWSQGRSLKHDHQAENGHGTHESGTDTGEGSVCSSHRR